jgi:hypothetical protein
LLCTPGLRSLLLQQLRQPLLLLLLPLLSPLLRQLLLLPPWLLHPLLLRLMYPALRLLLLPLLLLALLQMVRLPLSLLLLLLPRCNPGNDMLHCELRLQPLLCLPRPKPWLHRQSARYLNLGYGPTHPYLKRGRHGSEQRVARRVPNPRHHCVCCWAGQAGIPHQFAAPQELLHHLPCLT